VFREEFMQCVETNDHSMGDKDITSKRILKNLVREFAIVLFGLPVTEVELLETNHQRIEDRRADLVAKVALPDGSVLLLHIEVQNDTKQPPAKAGGFE
jgi:hypothetical protein